MKVQILEHAGHYYIRRYLFGFIPQYYSDCCGDWTVFRDAVSNLTHAKAEDLLNRWDAESKALQKLRETPFVVEKEIDINYL